MAHLLRMPEMAADAAEAVLEDWSVKENESFAAEDTLATVETDKALVEVEAEADGVILRTLVPAGASVAVGAPIAVVAAPGEGVTDVDALLVELGVADSADPPDGPSDPPPTPGSVERSSSSDGDPERRRVFISPLARRLARDAGLDHTEVEGSGPRGRIRRRDIEAAIAEADHAQRPEASAPQPPRAERATKRPHADAGFTDVPHSRLRRAVASRLAESKRTVPHFYLRGTAHVGALVGLRDELNAATSVKVSFNDLLLKAAAVALREHPEMNVIWTDDAVRGFDQVDIAVAVAGERGLVTPVLRGVDGLTVTQVAVAVRDLVDRANAGKLKQEELEGGCLSISNLGMHGTEEFAAIINPPQSAILAVGAVREEPVVRDGQVAVGQVLRFVLSIDHRPVDGTVAAAWMKTFLAVVESPVRILA